jgi:hypothetical protein
MDTFQIANTNRQARKKQAGSEQAKSIDTFIMAFCKSIHWTDTWSFYTLLALFVTLRRIFRRSIVVIAKCRSIPFLIRQIPTIQ